MNKELFIKLVKLANHNSNENEANLAARKACKLIESNNFEFTKEIKQSNLNSKTVRENVYKTQSYYNSKSDAYDWINDWINKNQQPFYSNPFKEKSKTQEKQKNKRKLKCKNCNKEKETIFQGPEDLFECNECQWSAYERSRKKE